MMQNITLIANEAGIYVRKCGITEHYVDKCTNPGVNIDIAHFLLVRAGYSLDEVRILNGNYKTFASYSYDGTGIFEYFPTLEHNSQHIPGKLKIRTSHLFRIKNF